MIRLVVMVNSNKLILDFLQERIMIQEPQRSNLLLGELVSVQQKYSHFAFLVTHKSQLPAPSSPISMPADPTTELSTQRESGKRA